MHYSDWSSSTVVLWQKEHRWLDSMCPA
jgi:hypothetical protein